MSKIKQLITERLSNVSEKKSHEYEFRRHAITAYFKGEVTAKELVQISRDSFGVEVGTKKEFEGILNSSFQLDMAVDQYDIDEKTLIAKIKDLIKLV